MWIKNKEWLNGKSYITTDELFADQLNVIKKLSLVLFSDAYYEDTKEFCRSILDFAINHEFITWKQANAVLDIRTTEERRRLFSVSRNRKNCYIYKTKKTTDREYDRFAEGIFGRTYFPEEEEGYVRDYDNQGSRIWLLPTGDEKFEDYI